MKRKTKLIILLSFLSMFVNSCKEESSVESLIEKDVKTTKSVDTFQMDIFSDEYKLSIQSSVEGMLLDQIIYRDSMYVLNMTEEEAMDLKIPDSLYIQYITIVNDLNARR